MIQYCIHVKNFSNQNAVTVFRWIFIRKDPLDQVVFYFLSRINFTSSRYFPLFNQNNQTRIVYLRGLPIKYSDALMLKIFRIFKRILKFRFNSYKFVHIFNSGEIYDSKYQVLHIDDPKYDNMEISKLLKWEQVLISKNSIPIIVCTNQFTAAWLKQFLQEVKIKVIEQGYYTRNNQLTGAKHNHFCCVYSSAYIHYGRDKHANESTWGVDNLFEVIIPELNSVDSEIFIHLIGELGNDAKIRATSLPNVICHGRVSPIENAYLLTQSDIAIYPRTFDHKRSILKIYSYIGAGLPVVTYDLIDTQIIKEKSLGISVNTTDEFVNSIVELKNNVDLLNHYSRRVNYIGLDYSWGTLVDKLNTELKSFL